MGSVYMQVGHLHLINPMNYLTASRQIFSPPLVASGPLFNLAMGNCENEKVQISKKSVTVKLLAPAHFLNWKKMKIQ